ncbi:MAG: hypothetical protein AAFP15_18870 [Bacteroidota bacterium]
MALITTAWLMGSNPSVPETTLDVTANAVTETLTIPAGGYYPYDSAAASSAIDTIRTVLLTHSQISAVTAIIGRDRRPRITADVAYSIDGWSDLSFRELLGFTGTEAFSQATQEAAGFSNYLWSPGRCEIPDAPVGSDGLPYHDTAVGQSGDRVVIATEHNFGRTNGFRFPFCRNARVATADELPGEYIGWWDAVQRRFARWKLYREVTEEGTDPDATQATLTTSIGPYVWRTSEQPIRFAYSRDIERVELFNTVTIPAVLTDDY